MRNEVLAKHIFKQSWWLHSVTEQIEVNDIMWRNAIFLIYYKQRNDSFLFEITTLMRKIGHKKKQPLRQNVQEAK